MSFLFKKGTKLTLKFLIGEPTAMIDEIVDGKVLFTHNKDRYQSDLIDFLCDNNGWYCERASKIKTQNI